MPTSADVLLDTSAAIPLIQVAHVLHDDMRAAVGTRQLGLAGHALIETFSVLTRLPGNQRVSPATAARIIEVSFPRSHALSARAGLAAVSTLQAAGIAGGAVYDGIVALAAREAGRPLVTCDRRALTTYDRLDVEVVVV